ncbi:TPA: helix-turn-helix domain-containing protein, partial [Candidatus Poribacteria bacterium]|nr:helix-turn-helix domain-containing protein [Candidatus Poribacteria bacterium]
KCKDVRMELVAYLDGELSTMGQRAVEAHLAECADCSQEAEELRGVTQLTQNCECITPKADWWANLQAKLESEKAKDIATEIRYLRNTLHDLSECFERQKMNSANSHEIMTLDEVANYLRVDADTIWNMLDELPHFQIGYELRFKKSSIDEWINAKENRLEFVDEQWFSGNDWFGQIDITDITRRRVNENRNR